MCYDCADLDDASEGVNNALIQNSAIDDCEKRLRESSYLKSSLSGSQK
jgi:hypothetical protein